MEDIPMAQALHWRFEGAGTLLQRQGRQLTEAQWSPRARPSSRDGRLPRGNGIPAASTALEDSDTVGLHPQGAWFPALDLTSHGDPSLGLKSLLKLGMLE